MAQTIPQREYQNLIQLVGISSIFTDSAKTEEIVKGLEEIAKEIATDYKSNRNKSNGIVEKAQQIVKKLNGYNGNFTTYDQKGHLVEIPIKTLGRVFFYRIGMEEYAKALYEYEQQPLI